MITLIRRSLFIFAFGLAAAGVARAEYPDKTVTFVVPFAAGSATDQLARALGQEVTRITKHAVPSSTTSRAHPASSAQSK